MHQQFGISRRRPDRAPGWLQLPLCPPPNGHSQGPQKQDLLWPFFICAASVVDPEGQQHISRRAAKPRVTGIDEHHAARDDRSRAVERSAVTGRAVHGGKVFLGVESPKADVHRLLRKRGYAHPLNLRTRRPELPSRRRVVPGCIPAAAERRAWARRKPKLFAGREIKRSQSAALDRAQELRSRPGRPDATHRPRRPAVAANARRRIPPHRACGHRLPCPTARRHWSPPLPTRVCQSSLPSWSGSRA